MHLKIRYAFMDHMAKPEILDDNGVNYTVRRTLGSDVDASCGQLRRKIEKKLSDN